MHSDVDYRHAILAYLTSRQQNRDRLNGIVLGVFDREYRHIEALIVRALGRLIAEGLVEEHTDNSGLVWYRLLQKASEPAAPAAHRKSDDT